MNHVSRDTQLAGHVSRDTELGGHVSRDLSVLIYRYYYYHLSPEVCPGLGISMIIFNRISKVILCYDFPRALLILGQDTP